MQKENQALERLLTSGRWGAYFRLMRINKPIGTLLLLWPTLWALWLAGRGAPTLWTLLVFVAGVFFDACRRVCD
ncbi:hypothetical protein DZJ_28910 [Dickeya ananatis]